MCPQPDPRETAMAETETGLEAEAEAVSAAQSAGVAPDGPAIRELPSDLATLRERGDTEELLRIGFSVRETEPAKAITAFETAAELGSTDGQWQSALMHLDGLGVDTNTKSGVALLRSAANGGHVDAKIRLANMYHLGIHFTQDADKADVWYRSAARSSGLEDDELEPDERLRRMAELGAVREVLALVKNPDLSKKERFEHLQTAKRLGYVPSRASALPAEPEPPAEDDNAHDAEPQEQASTAATDPETEQSAGKPAKRPARRPRSPLTVRSGAQAFLPAALFGGVAWVIGYAARELAKTAADNGHPLPIVGDKPFTAQVLAVLLITILPCFIVYRAVTVFTGLGAGVLAGGIGYYLFRAGTQWLPEVGVQVLAFSLVGFLVGVLVYGFMGGSKADRPTAT